MVVLLSGTVIAYRGNPIEIVYGVTENQIRLTFEFIDQEGLAQSRMESNIELVQARQGVETTETQVQVLEFKLFNFKDRLGSGTKDPVEIARLNGHRVFLHFRVHHMPDSDKTFHYTLFHEKRPAAPTNVRVY
jgi:hypothetical protein